MTNKEFYGDKLLAVALENTCRKLRKAVYGENCVESNCKDCEFYTVQSIENWLNAEHEEPLLANGDGLKPGDWIMVRNSDEDKWSKEQFLFYYPYSSSDRNFACAYHDGVIGDGDYFTWKQARLPEEGE